MRTILMITIFGMVFYNCQPKGDIKPPESQTAKEDWILVWADEFEGEGLVDSSKWSYSIGDGCPMVCGWGNNELQWYTEEETSNARVVDGHLIIEAHNEETGTKEYSSAKLTTQNKQHMKYGKIEVRAKLPSGKGTWPAVWMMPVENTYGGWPKSGEIDIMEHVGYNPDTIFGTIHTESFNHIKGTQKEGQIYMPDAENDFKTYAIEWDEDQLSWFVDDEEYHTFTNTGNNSDEWPFDQPFYLILNLAVGGNWGGKYGVDDDIWPQRMEIDYVRYYQKNKS